MERGALFSESEGRYESQFNVSCADRPVSDTRNGINDIESNYLHVPTGISKGTQCDMCYNESLNDYRKQPEGGHNNPESAYTAPCHGLLTQQRERSSPLKVQATKELYQERGLNSDLPGENNYYEVSPCYDKNFFSDVKVLCSTDINGPNYGPDPGRTQTPEMAK